MILLHGMGIRNDHFSGRSNMKVCFLNESINKSEGLTWPRWIQYYFPINSSFVCANNKVSISIIQIRLNDDPILLISWFICFAFVEIRNFIVYNNNNWINTDFGYRSIHLTAPSVLTRSSLHWLDVISAFIFWAFTKDNFLYWKKLYILVPMSINTNYYLSYRLIVHLAIKLYVFFIYFVKNMKKWILTILNNVMMI